MKSNPMYGFDHCRVLRSVVTRYNFEAIDAKVRHGNNEVIDMTLCVAPDGSYIGGTKEAYLLCKKRGIVPQRRKPELNVSTIGWCSREKKWYGWSHRAIFGFGVGSRVKKGDCAYRPKSNGGRGMWTAKSLSDAKEMASDFAESVS